MKQVTFGLDLLSARAVIGARVGQPRDNRIPDIVETEIPNRDGKVSWPKPTSFKRVCAVDNFEPGPPHNVPLVDVTFKKKSRADRLVPVKFWNGTRTYLSTWSRANKTCTIAKNPSSIFHRLKQATNCTKFHPIKLMRGFFWTFRR